jgi:hypothetical protein
MKMCWSRAMPHSAGLFCIEFVCKSCAMPHSAGPWSRAMPHSAGSKWHSAGSKGQTLAPCCIAWRNNLSKIRSKVNFHTYNLRNTVLKSGPPCKNFYPALCGIARDQTLWANISANSNLGPRDNRLTKKRGSNISWHCPFKTAEAASAASLKPRKPTISNDHLEFFGEFEAICKTALAVNQGPRGGGGWLIDKKRGKICWHCPFNRFQKPTI